MEGANTSTPVSRMNVIAVSRLCLSVSVSVDRLDLALDGRAVSPGLGDDLDRLALVRLDGQGRRVEEHGVPASFEAVGDDLPLRAVIEMQRHGHLDARRHRLPHAEEHVQPDRLDGLDRRLHDHGRPRLDRSGEHRLEREVVHDVDRRHPVALTEGPIDDLPQ